MCGRIISKVMAATMSGIDTSMVSYFLFHDGLYIKSIALNFSLFFITVSLVHVLPDFNELSCIV